MIFYVRVQVVVTRVSRLRRSFGGKQSLSALMIVVGMSISSDAPLAKAHGFRLRNCDCDCSDPRNLPERGLVVDSFGFRKDERFENKKID